MTDNDIIKELEDCTNVQTTHHTCDCCKLFNVSKGGMVCVEYALDLINRQKAEIKSLTSGKCIYLSDDETTEYCVEGPCPHYKTKKQIKNEAIKEFVKKLYGLDSLIVCNGTYIVDFDDIEKLRDEMVGDNDEKS